MVDILYIANALPYDKIAHAGGKTFNFYVKRLISTRLAKVKVIGICKEEEMSKLDNKEYGFDVYPVITKGSFFTNLRRVLWDIYGKVFGKKSYGQSFFKTKRILDEALRLGKSGYTPNVIFLEWTNCVFLVEAVKKIFPNSKIIASEPDVSFLGIERRYLNSTKNKDKLYKEYLDFKKRELEALQKCDYIYPQSLKDKDLLVKEGVDSQKIGVLAPFYHDMSHVKRSEKLNHDILFWGAMYRPENCQACIWFIQNVMPLLSDTDIRFIVAGNKPTSEMLSYASERVIVTGFVEDETPLFAESLCFVAPLINGAGIKVKVIEALSTGIPVLTNDIGIEGIAGIDGDNYFHCINAQEYANKIRELLNNSLNLSSIEVGARKLIKDNFDLESSFKNYIKSIQDYSAEMLGKDVEL